MKIASKKKKEKEREKEKERKCADLPLCKNVLELWGVGCQFYINRGLHIPLCEIIDLEGLSNSCLTMWETERDAFSKDRAQLKLI